MKNIKKVAHYQLFVNALGWYLRTVNNDPRVRLVMLVIQAIAFHYATQQRRAVPVSVEETMDFLDGTMKERRKGKDDPLLDLYTVLLSSIKGIVDTVDFLKANHIKQDPAFWDYILIEMVAERSRYTLQVARESDLVRTNYQPTIEQAIRADIEKATNAANYPPTNYVANAKTLVNMVSMYREMGLLNEEMTQQIISNFDLNADLTPLTGSDTGAAAAPDTACQEESAS